MTDLVAIVLNFNAPDDTIRCVRSLGSALAQGSIIVIDNGSSDGSPETIRRALPSVEVVEAGANRGYGAGNNAGIRVALARGARHVLLLNNDTEVVHPEFVSSLLSALADNARTGIAGPLVRYPDGTVQPTTSKAPSFRLALALAIGARLRRRPSSEGALEREVEVLNGVCLLVRSEVLERTGGFDEHYFMYVEEADFAARARHLGWTSLYVPVPSIIHHHQFGDDRGSGTRVRVNFVRFCATHRGRGSAVASALLFLTGAALRDLRGAKLRELPSLVHGLRDLMAGKQT
jgi:N-acetylglucosaminyl-diphospho-decaprenol L-rhamnosyltransferase